VPSITGSVLGNGILVEVSLGVSFPREAAMHQAGLSIPVRQHATFVVDTGADRTLVDEQIMRQLGLTPSSQTRIITSTSSPQGDIADTYDVSLEIKNAAEAPWRTRAVAAPGHAGNDRPRRS
jgi:Aspartyl protease